MVKIFIDPGHGGSDTGALGNGLKEKDLTLTIATNVRSILLTEYNDVSILMSRMSDETVTLTQRTDAANTWGADYFLSIHINAGGGTGYEDYVYPGTTAPTTTYQTNMHNEIMKLITLTDRGRKSANFHVLRESHMPAILTENGFIDTSSDAALLKSASHLDKVARGHVNGLVKNFNLTKKVTATYHTVVSGDTVYALSIQYGSTVQQIKDWNKLDSKYTIIVGQVLRVK
ncbi:N-acetylmuramoyl-L-alanine amidase [Paenibacillus sp. Marseille-Q4541]|uniref:N-acetylmuramoyl-L-alanine amidase family protein n=1 Tax=Paenibacillus sp. Marseille-Q4541 TaxID=2831522 RepID=UPI001BABD3F1|nr:N-acetylmuramoyl-L-alanine amidase [Paenibacillus sp. Marseille-Q4541]